MSELLFNTAEAAAELCISSEQLLRWVKKKQGPVGFKAGRQYLFRKSDVQGFLVQRYRLAKEEYDRASQYC